MTDRRSARKLWIVDTNVLVAGLLTADSESPTAKILDAMLSGQIRFLLSVELLTEYRAVLSRSAIRKRHKLIDSEVDALLEVLATNASVADISGRSETAPDAGDDHLWRLLAARSGTGLITGDAALLKKAPSETLVVSPRDWVNEFG